MRLTQLLRGLAVAVVLGVVNGTVLAVLVWVAIQRY